MDSVASLLGLLMGNGQMPVLQQVLIQVGCGSRELICLHAESVHQRQKEIPQQSPTGCVAINLMMLSVTKATTDEQCRQVRVVVRIGVAHATAKHHCGAVEQRSVVCILVCLQLIEEASQPIDVFRAHQVIVGDLRGIVAVVRETVVAGTPSLNTNEKTLAEPVKSRFHMSCPGQSASAG